MKKSGIAIALIAVALIAGCTAVGFAVWDTPDDVIEVVTGEVGVKIDLTSKIFGDNADKLLPIGANMLKDENGVAQTAINGNAIAKMGRLRLHISQDAAPNGVTFSFADLRVDDKKIKNETISLYFLSGYSEAFDYLDYVASGFNTIKVLPEYEGDRITLPTYLGATYDPNTETYSGGTAQDKSYTKYMAAGETYEFTMLVVFTESAADIDGTQFDFTDGKLTFELNVKTNE